jgi:hypothetical protein
MIEQLQWNYQSEIATLFPGHKAIRSLCQIIDSHISKGRKVADLQEQLLQWVLRDGTPQQWTEAVNYIKGGL